MGTDTINQIARAESRSGRAGSQIREVPYFREIKSGLAPCFTPYFCLAPLREPARCPPSGGFSLGRSRQPIADYRFCTAGGNEDDVAGFHLCHHCLAARLGRTVTHANFFAEFARRDHNCRPALFGSASQLRQQFVPEMVNGNQLNLPRDH